MFIQQYHPKVWSILGADIFRGNGYMIHQIVDDSSHIRYQLADQTLVQQRELAPQYSWWQNYGLVILLALGLLFIMTKSWVYETFNGYKLNRIYDKTLLIVISAISCYDIYIRESWIFLRFCLFMLICIGIPVILVRELKKMEEKELSLFLAAFKKMRLPRKINPKISYARVYTLLGIGLIFIGLTATLAKVPNMYLAVGANQLMIFLALKYHN
jgi:hypothetical protein